MPPLKKSPPLKIVERKIKDLIFAEYNPRRLTEAQGAALKDSLARFGFVDPVIVNMHKARRNIIVGGHQRVRVWQAMGGTVVPTVEVRLDRDRERELNVRLNRNLGEWDWDMLANEFDTADLLAWGFDEEELTGAFGADEDPQDAEPQTDRAAEVNKKWKVKTGDLWLIGEHRLLCGDSTKADDVGRVLGAVVPFLCVTDPPYGVEYDANWRNEADRANGKPFGDRAIGKVTNDDRADWRETWVLFPGDVIYSWHPAGATSLVHAVALQDSGFKIRMQIIWAKNQFPIGRGDYHVKHEPCWYCVRDKKAARFTADRSQTTLWEIDKPQKSETGHSTQKPLECMMRPIRNHDAPEVYDPFLGSGTTMVAAQNLDRKCYGIEISPDYCAVILERMKTAFPDLAVKLKE